MDVDDDDDDDVADKSRRTFSGPRSLEFPTRKTKTNEISLSFVSFSPLFFACRLSRRLSRVRVKERAQNGPLVLYLWSLKRVTFQRPHRPFFWFCHVPIFFYLRGRNLKQQYDETKKKEAKERRGSVPPKKEESIP